MNVAKMAEILSDLIAQDPEAMQKLIDHRVYATFTDYPGVTTNKGLVGMFGVLQALAQAEGSSLFWQRGPDGVITGVIERPAVLATDASLFLPA